MKPQYHQKTIMEGIAEAEGERKEAKPKQQICYKTNEPCKYDCKGLCRESM
ncbi:hypothetical protein [uncultured Draconibacterium sp.]|uniref:hypothetical protein n=1 Tax=uncultured Draconibacterium sp. TaxID=1573823 RepID=UPI0029C8E511|nr:hypothetical protein [uncultured Draconibacterium sp.]